MQASHNNITIIMSEKIIATIKGLPLSVYKFCDVLIKPYQ